MCNITLKIFLYFASFLVVYFSTFDSITLGNLCGSIGGHNMGILLLKSPLYQYGIAFYQVILKNISKKARQISRRVELLIIHL